mmetsp:Transcript_6795/g.10086  ORF Transcript_6795/g.10086 Transcript_6795/m.10086 type:complete len:209 (-) Transcript_6795:442-1068(-)
MGFTSPAFGPCLFAFLLCVLDMPPLPLELDKAAVLPLTAEILTRFEFGSSEPLPSALLAACWPPALITSPSSFALFTSVILTSSATPALVLTALLFMCDDDPFIAVLFFAALLVLFISLCLSSSLVLVGSFKTPQRKAPSGIFLKCLPILDSACMAFRRAAIDNCFFCFSSILLVLLLLLPLDVVDCDCLLLAAFSTDGSKQLSSTLL